MVRRRTRVKPRRVFNGQVRDVDGSIWDVRESRATKHGFDLHFGRRAYDHLPYCGGLPKLIVTPALMGFWITNRIKGHGFLFDLPAGRTTLKRLRSQLGLNQKDDWEQFWQDRIADLGSLKPSEFSAQHGVREDNVFDRRTKMLGVRARAIGWWRNPKTIKLLLSDLTLREIGEKLGIKTSHVFRLRNRAKAELQPGSAQ